ncbi:SWI/SNF and RSC complexes subunit ssr3 [Wickerhamiella sorbophila]|uniref:SWI/SNF and RSC complexes subunit ssr3 n=1 Tax=Wickerhamiella sorbophila TaxID=45607 RepID=A0A2T0FF80_9ASCO|nr:SWI/SNF and RSC complexes subunit ssr3 [Wickerhamiella sorbophila]PRT53634.1 SWI/SNF and RSC complexes subunit ssr3 [Wickerhamiella sorbophila]
MPTRIGERQFKRKPTDRKLRESVLETIPEAKLLIELQKAEVRLDTTVNRKRLDLQDVVGRSMRRNKTLRIFISSSVTGQPWQTGNTMQTDFDFGDMSPPVQSLPEWMLRIEGRLVDEGSDHHRLFSSMFTSIIIELHREGDSNNADPAELGLPEPPAGVPPVDAGPKPEIVEWHEPPPHSTEQRIDFDGIDIRRGGETPVKAKIILQLKEYPAKFKLSPALADVLGVDEESKPGAVVALWQYIRFHKLQDIDEKRNIKCDPALKKLFNRDQLSFPQLVELLGPHLTPRDPIVLEYMIEPQTDKENRDVAYDVPLQVDDPLRSDLITMLDSWHQDNIALSKQDEQLVQDVQQLNLLAMQREFYQKLADNPQKLLDDWVATQARDLKAIYSHRQFSEEAVRHSSFYKDDVLNSSIHLFLNSR